MSSLYVLPFCVSFVVTTIIYLDKYSYCSAEGECIYNSFPDVLYSNTGKLINDGSYDRLGESGPYFGDANSGISNAYGGPYFWFIEAVKGELNSYRSDDDYNEYTLYISFTIYDKSGNIMDSYKTDVDYKHNKSESLYKYNYETYEDRSDFEDELKYDLREKINNYIKELVKSHNKELVKSHNKELVKSHNKELVNNNSNSDRNHSTSPKQTPSKKPKTRTVSEPIQTWKDCVSCFGGGLCQYCGGSGVIYYMNGSQPCAACGGFGKCSLCAGRGGEYHVEYVERTETYYE